MLTDNQLTQFNVSGVLTVIKTMKWCKILTTQTNKRTSFYPLHIIAFSQTLFAGIRLKYITFEIENKMLFSCCYGVLVLLAKTLKLAIKQNI